MNNGSTMTAHQGAAYPGTGHQGKRICLGGNFQCCMIDPCPYCFDVHNREVLAEAMQRTTASMVQTRGADGYITVRELTADQFWAVFWGHYAECWRVLHAHMLNDPAIAARAFDLSRIPAHVFGPAPGPMQPYFAEPNLGAPAYGAPGAPGLNVAQGAGPLYGPPQPGGGAPLYAQPQPPQQPPFYGQQPQPQQPPFYDQQPPHGQPQQQLYPQQPQQQFYPQQPQPPAAPTFVPQVAPPPQQAHLPQQVHLSQQAHLPHQPGTFPSAVAPLGHAPFMPSNERPVSPTAANAAAGAASAASPPHAVSLGSIFEHAATEAGFGPDAQTAQSASGDPAAQAQVEVEAPLALPGDVRREITVDDIAAGASPVDDEPAMLNGVPVATSTP